MKPRIIVCGLGGAGYKVFSLLRQQGARVVGVHPEPLAQEERDVIVGDLRSPSTLIAAGVREAHTLVAATSDDTLNLGILAQARVLNPKIRIINRLFNASLGDRLDHILPDHVSMSVAALSAPVFAFSALGNRAIGQLQLFGQTWPIREEVIHDEHPWLGRPLSSLWEDRNRMLIYYLPADNCQDLVTAVMEGQTLQWGDRLILASKPQLDRSRRPWQDQMLNVLSYIQQFHPHIRPTLVVLLALAVTIWIATVIYTGATLHTSFVDALYFAVGMITGAGGNEEVAEQAPPNIKVFTVMLMLIGTAVVGICYALLNDLVLGARLQNLWHVIPIPRRGHCIVCGLGNVGMQTVRHLKDSGCDVVVIEPDPNNRFLGTARSLRVPVLVGDASLASTLQEANIQQARALLALTSQDIVNLEIALTAKGLAPELSVTVRNRDPQFASLAQQVFDFEAVLSPADLSAPSFAAAALGGKVLGNGVAGHSLWISLATCMTATHPFLGRQVQDIATETDCVPLYLETTHGTIHGWELLKTTLTLDDVLYITLPASRLEMLWQSRTLDYQR
ncbi:MULTISPECIES: NAD-binding protein [unclassified Leptolyngbya]|uniref:potassium channel family protein n=1 Tax=unclassified Leptolyngbya TaxID=2650499 RepID=UPI0016887265|nr:MULTISPECIES: NAD-binding protein [unclassified Leptolyngbya]MBD1911798.1 NAD-binding protein [Leptolyngbya sp. FACHB-8]MBD2153312.1 NAD-binding protein [Leptolyngbya sp. FACHB-16]